MDNAPQISAPAERRSENTRSEGSIALSRAGLFTFGVLGAFIVAGFLWFADPVSAACPFYTSDAADGLTPVALACARRIAERIILPRSLV